MRRSAPPLRSARPLRAASLCLMALLLFLAGCGHQAEAIEFVTLARGHHSGIREQTAVLITDKDAWQTYWQRHAAPFVPPPSPPPVNFAEASVVAVHLGERRTGGYRLTISAIHQADGVLQVTAVESRPAPGSVVTMALTQPYHIVRLQRVEPGTRLKVAWQVEEAR